MIRAATDADAPWIMAIWNTVIADTLATFTTELKTQSAVTATIAAQTVLVLPQEGGFATFSPFRPGPGYAATMEHTILLAPHSRGQGQGRALMAALAQSARAQGHRVLVGAISSANPGAVAFHAALGFELVGHLPQVGHKAGQWLDLILMQKHLHPTGSP